ncbi:MAG TPA: branched-chain amino acid ABC transporter permease [Acidimicrobiia bacterium]|nr:branched-chain amino acid ABC transporter permease [Acidimicrobiia bacterium]
MWLSILGVAVALGVVTDDQRIMTIAIQTYILAALASSWNILGGFAGQISLGHAAFFGLGALVTREMWLGGQPFPLSTLAAMVVTAVVAAIVGVPMLRFRDAYFSIGTLALGVAVFLTIGNVRPGISSLPVDALREYEFTGPYFLALGVMAFTVPVSMWLKQGKLGLGMMAVRDDEEVAGASGVSPLRHKLMAFVISAALAALAGSVFAYFSISYYPSFPFSVVWTFEAILVVFIGGIGTTVGPLIGSAFFIVGRYALASNTEEFQVVLFGLLFIIVVLLLPGGLVEGWQRIFGGSASDVVTRAMETKTGETKGKELV